MQFVCPLTVDALADVQHTVVVEDLGAPRDPRVPRAKKGGRVANALKRLFHDQVGQGFSGGVSLIRDAIDLWYTFPLDYKLNCKFCGVASNVTGATA